MGDRDKKLIITTCICCVMTLVISVLFFSCNNFDLHVNSKNSVVKFSEGWEYTTNILDKPTSVTLPSKLPICYGTNKVILQNKLPPKCISGGTLRFEVSFQQADIYIDGKLRKSYGNANMESFLYPYYNAEHYIMLDLRPEDYGKNIKIVVQAAEAFAAELSIIDVPQIGEHSDFIIQDLLNQWLNVFAGGLCLIIAWVLLVVVIIRFFKKQKSLQLLLLSAFTIIWLLFYTSDFIFLWEIFNYSPLYSAINDMKFYILDSFLPIISFVALQYIVKFDLPDWKKKSLSMHRLLYIVATILHIMAICSINYFRPILMLFSMVNFCFIIKPLLFKIKEAEYRYFGIGIIVLLLAYFIDYIKYAIPLLPISNRMTVFFQVDVPPLLFLGLALPIYCGYIFYGTVILVQNEKRRLKEKIVIDILTGVGTRVALYEEFDNMKLDNSDTSYYLAMIDIDNFKGVNDTYGHIRGDKVLSTLGSVLIEKGDNLKAFRIGGDEFCILFKGKNLNDTIQILKDVQDKFSIRAIKISEDVKVTLSIGVAKWLSSQLFNTVIHNADEALYKSKNNNKNCISVYKESD